MAGAYESIGIDKSAGVCIVISGLQIIEPGLSVVDVTTICQGVGCAEGRSHATSSGQELAPSVVRVFADCRALIIQKGNYVTLQVGNVVVNYVVIRYRAVAAVSRTAYSRM